MTTPPPQDPFASPPPGQGAPDYGPPPAPAWGPAPVPGQQYGQQYGQPAWGQQQYAAPQTDARAIVALVFAIGSFVVFPVVPAIVALVLAGQSRREIDASGGRLTGEGLLTAARVVAWVNLGLAVAVVAFFVLFVVVFGVLAV